MKTIRIFSVLFFLLAQAGHAAEFSADMVMETAFGLQTGKFYHKNPDLSRTEMMGMTSIVKYPMVYQVFDETRKYVVTDLEEMSQDYPGAHVRDFDEFIKENGFEKVGSETIEGYKTSIYQGQLEIGPGQDGQPMTVSMKLWYSRELNYALKTETSLPAHMGGRVVSHLKNISKGRQAESLFEVPAGYTQVSSIPQAMGFGSMSEGMEGMPSIQDMPSQQEMDEMMEMMQEMMQQMAQ
ncbi:DUF4412 domain-containing protein [Desulfonatronovibrio hydrogenovorans]|uniref:DUF4412 domain-containing protein n=1 Tax=Desulfonatronovibrio hydrogenovorans TaxID=53245 RepID=UPI00048DC898|nr:DUF4412 domain-containing protein [Desulfonatronovibrio hydrogenovorans]